MCHFKLIIINLLEFWGKWNIKRSHDLELPEVLLSWNGITKNINPRFSKTLGLGFE